MSRFGWAYVNDVITGSGGSGSVPGGSDKAIQFASGSTFSGSTNFTFDYTTNTVRLTGTLYADNLIVSSSTIFKSGSTKFGDDPTDTHQFTGSIYNTALVSGTIATFTTITGSAITSNLITGSSLIISASVISASTYLGISVPTASGGDKAIQFASGSTFSGSNNLTFDYTTKVLSLTGTTLISGSLTSTNTITATSASFLDYVQLGNNLSDEVYFNASSKTNIQPATTNDVDLGASSRYWRTGYITTLSSSAISSSVSVYTSEVRAGSVIVNGNISGSGNINGAGLQITGGGSFGATVNVTGTVSSSIALQTAGTITAASNITSTGGTISSSAGIDTAGPIRTSNTLFVSGAIIATGSITTNGTFTGDGSNITGIQGSNVNGVGDDWSIQFKDGITGTLTSSANLLFSGSTLTLTGSLLMTGSSTFINIGPTILSGNLNVSGALTGNNAYISGGLSVGNYIQMLPVGNVEIPTNQTASYIYTSGSTNDLYFTQYQPGTNFTNTTRLRWLEGMLTTGLLHGGVLSTATGSTTFSITSGSGIILSYNATLTTDPYPTINYVNWPAYVSQSLTYVTSSLITYIGINSTGGIIQQTSPFTLTTDSDYISIGRVLHQSGSVTNGVSTQPIVSYGTNHWQDDFTRAFGPLKVSGHILAASGSTLGITKTAGDSYVIGRNYTNNPNNPNNITSANDTAVTVSKIYRAYVSGSTLRLDTGVNNAGYTTINPAQYNNNGTLASVGSSEASIQRVYWYPNTVSRAFTVYYGSAVYSDPPGGTNALDVAQQNIASENFVEGENTAGAAILVGYILALGSATDLSNTAQARFIQAGVSRGAGAGGGGGVAVGATNAAGLDTYVQFNDGGSTFGGDAGLTYNKTTDTLSGVVAQFTTISGSTINGSAYSGGSFTGTTISGTTAQFTTITASVVSASSYVGNGSGLTGIGPSLYTTKYLQTFIPSPNSLQITTNPYTQAVVKNNGGGSIQGNGASSIISGAAYGDLTTGNTADTGETLATFIGWNSGGDNDYYTSSLNPIFRTRIRTDSDVSNMCIFAGLRRSSNVGGGAGIFTNLTGNSNDYVIGVGYITSSTLSTNGQWILYTENGTPTTRTSTGVSVSTNTTYDIVLTITTGSVTATINNVSVSTTGTIPNSFISPYVAVSTLTSSVKKLFFAGYDVRY